MTFCAGAKCIINKRQRASQGCHKTSASAGVPAPQPHSPALCPVGAKSANFTHFHLLLHKKPSGGGGSEQAAGGIAASGRQLQALCHCVCESLCVCCDCLLFLISLQENEAELPWQGRSRRSQGNSGAQVKPKAKDTACHSLCAKLRPCPHPPPSPPQLGTQANTHPPAKLAAAAAARH